MLAGRGVLGDAVGQLYAQRYFSPETKAQIEAMVANIIAAFRRRIDALSWMDSATKAKTFGSDCAPALRHSAIIFCTRTQGRCNQHGMGEGILG